MSKDLLEQMIFPKIMQCSAIDLKLNTQVRDDEAWAWAEGMSDAHAQDVFLADVVPAVPAHMVFDEDWIPSMPCTTSAVLEHRDKNPTSSRASTLWLRDLLLAKKCWAILKRWKHS